MTFYNSAGTRLTEAQVNALTTTPSNLPVYRQFTADVYQAYTEGEGAGGFEKASHLAFVTGEVVPQSVIDALFKTATFASITPNTGLAAGGTAFTLKGTDLSGSAGVTIGGVAVTSFKVVNDTTITGVTGAHATGAVAVVIQDDGGDVSTSAAFTYA